MLLQNKQFEKDKGKRVWRVWGAGGVVVWGFVVDDVCFVVSGRGGELFCLVLGFVLVYFFFSFGWEGIEIINCIYINSSVKRRQAPNLIGLRMHQQCSAAPKQVWHDR